MAHDKKQKSKKKDKKKNICPTIMERITGLAPYHKKKKYMHVSHDTFRIVLFILLLATSFFM